MNYIQIKNWEKFQHYKDRSPPWIKLHRELLNDYHFTSLQDASKAHLMLLWLLASQLDNRIPDDSRWLKNKLGLTSNIDLNELISKGFLVLVQDASAAQAKRSPETETETDIIKITHENLSISHIEEWLTRKRVGGEYLTIDENRLLEKFKDYCRSKNPKYKDYVAAFRNSFEWKDTPKKGNQNESNRASYRTKSQRADNAVAEFLAEKQREIEPLYADSGSGEAELRHIENLRERTGAVEEPDEDVRQNSGGIRAF